MADPELIAPAGNISSLFAALQYGADSIYLGLKEFSARAQAQNFTLEELKPIINYARKINKRIYIAFNTLIKTQELDYALSILEELSIINPHGIIIQDLGICHLIKKYFPNLPIHFSTQTTIHNIEGVKTAQELGAKRVILARELTLPEIETIRKNTKIELEVFIHGARCYSYSGLCLFSSFIGGRSGNRGLCAQPCRMKYRAKEKEGYFFSMCDLTAVNEIEKLINIGVDAFKIEGRLKSPLYTAFVTQMYRNILDHKKIDLEKTQEILKTIFSRETKSIPKKIQGELLTSDLHPGHLGLYIGKVSETKGSWFTFKTNSELEKYDGLQILISNMEEPMGFSIRNMRVNNENVYTVSKNSVVTIQAPFPIQKNPSIYLSSKRQLKDIYSISMPKLEMPKMSITLSVEIGSNTIKLSTQNYSQEYPVTTLTSKSKALNNEILYKYFSRLGDSPHKLDKLLLKTEPDIFIPPRELNSIRRRFFDELDKNFILKKKKDYLKEIFSSFPSQNIKEPQFSIKIDRLAHLEPVIPHADRLIIDLSPWIMNDLEKALKIIKGVNKPIVFSIPPIIKDNQKYIIKRLLESGYKQFEISNLAGIQLLPKKGITISSDYQLYITNPVALETLKELGITRGTFSPELSKKDLTEILNIAKNTADIILYSDISWFYSSQCVWLSIYKKCPEKTKCKYSSINLVSKKGDKLIAINNDCSTILINKEPFSWTHHLQYFNNSEQMLFRIDFVNINYPPEIILNIIDEAKVGNRIRETLDGNFHRELF